MAIIKASDFGAIPDSITDRSAVINQALVAAGSGNVCWLDLPGRYMINSPLLVPEGCTLLGIHAPRWVYNMPGAKAPTTIEALGTFSGNAMIYVDGSAGDVDEGVISLISLYGSQVVAHGIMLYGGCRGWVLENISITQLSETGSILGFDPAGVRTQTFSRSGTTVFPKGLHIENVWSYSNMRGFSLSNLTDSEINNSGAQDNAKDGFYLADCQMVTGRNIQGLFNRNRGIEITGSSSDMVDLQVVTDRNEFDGVRINGTAAGYVKIRGITRRDGRNANAGGGSYAGVAIVGTTSNADVNVGQGVGVDDNGTGSDSPAYGVRVTGTTFAKIGGSLRGVTAAISDGGTNSNVFIAHDTRAATGIKSTPVMVEPDAGVSAASFVYARRDGGSLILSSDPTDATVAGAVNGRRVYQSATGADWVRVAGAWQTTDTLVDADHGNLLGLLDQDHPQYQADWNGRIQSGAPRQEPSASSALTANGGRCIRLYCNKTGSLRHITAYCFTQAAAGNYYFAVYDCGDALATSYTRLWTSSATAIPADDNFMTIDPGAGAISVVPGQQIMVYIGATQASVIGKAANTANSKLSEFANSSFNPGPVLNIKKAFTITGGTSYPPPSAILASNTGVTTVLPWIEAMII